MADRNSIGYYTRWRDDPAGCLQFDFEDADGSRVSMLLHRGRFIAIGNGGDQMTRFMPPLPWGYGGAPVKGSTKAYLKELLKPYHIPDEVIDGESSSANSN